MTIGARDALNVLALVTEAGARPCLAGGWGAEALLGGQHRDHHSITVLIDLEDLDPVVNAVTGVGFTITFDARPARVELTDDVDNVIELATLRRDPEGHRWQVGGDQYGRDLAVPADEIITGWIAGRTVRCVGARLQVAQRRGIEPDREELADLQRLRERFGVWLPEGFR